VYFVELRFYSNLVEHVNIRSRLVYPPKIKDTIKTLRSPMAANLLVLNISFFTNIFVLCVSACLIDARENPVFE